MIEKMKKLTFLVYHKEYDDFLHRLQELGAMHVEGGTLTDDQSATVNADLAEIQRTEAILKRLADIQELAKKELTSDPSSKERVVDTTEGEGQAVDTLISRLDDLAARKADLSEKVEALTPWGEFDPADVRTQMAAANCEMRFFTAPTKVFNKEIAPTYPVEAISEVKGKTHFVAILHSASSVPVDSFDWNTIPATEVTIPDAPLSALRAELDATSVQYAATLSQLQQLATTETPALQARLKDLRAHLAFDTVRATTATAADDSLMVLHGWIPAKREADINAAFADSGAWYEVSDPQPGDDIPICLKNNRFFKLFEMFTELYMLPKYNELDLTPFLAPFYIIFFGLCLGDSGYGLFITLGVLAVKFFVKDLSQSMKAAMNLLLTLGISAFFCGLLSGAFFGFNLYQLNVPLFDSIGNVVALDNSQMFNLSLILGFIQIIFGMCLKAYNRTIQLGFAFSLSTIGWMLVILSLAVTLLMPEYGDISQWLTYAGLALAFLLNSPERYKKNPATGLLINVGSGLWDAYNTATGMLGDMLSYVRLFALGLSGGILATVFDSLATGLAPDNAILGPIVMVLIFVFGHALNMFMNVLGAFVHPMRLTFVEFFKNAGYEGGGTAYNPFK